MNEQLQANITELTNKLNMLSEEIYTTLAKQAFVQGIQDLIFIILFSILTTYYVKFVKPRRIM